MDLQFGVKPLTKKFTRSYVYFMQLTINRPLDIKLTNCARVAALVFNRTVCLQVKAYKGGLSDALSPAAVKLDLPNWKKHPGMGRLEIVPAPVINFAISDACRKVQEAFRTKRDFKFPILHQELYKHLEFTRAIKYNNAATKLFLPGFEMFFKYKMLECDPATHGAIAGTPRKLWLVKYEQKWLALLWTRAETEAGTNAVPALRRAGKERLRRILDYTYDKQHWIANAHQERIKDQK